MKARPEVQMAALEGRLVDVDNTLVGLRFELAELARLLEEHDRRWDALRTYDSYREVHSQRRRPPASVSDTGEV